MNAASTSLKSLAPAGPGGSRLEDGLGLSRLCYLDALSRGIRKNGDRRM